MKHIIRNCNGISLALTRDIFLTPNLNHMQILDYSVMILLVTGIMLIAICLILKRKTAKGAFSSLPKQEYTEIPEGRTEQSNAHNFPEKLESAALTTVGSPEIEDTEIPLTLDITKPKPVLNNDLSGEQIGEKLINKYGKYDPRLDLASYKFPSVDLLDDYLSRTSPETVENLEKQKMQMVSTLKSHGIALDYIKATIGPTMTLFEIVPAPGVRIATIKKLEQDIGLSLMSTANVLGQLPDKGTIGIEVQNKNPHIVSMRSVLSSDTFLNNSMDLPIVLGKTMDDEVYIADLSKMPHLLIAGATGQGKSVSINAIITSLIFKKNPSEVKFVLVDINRLELTLYRRIEQHFLAALPGYSGAVITEHDKVADTLTSLCLEMEHRFALLNDAQVRNISNYNEKFVNKKIVNAKNHRYLPFIVLVIDEFSDLVTTSDKTIESLISQIAQRGRSIGIHLILSTQRPAINVITGTIKANFPSRLAFRLPSVIDSKTVFDMGGAEQLKGNGDLLYSDGTSVIHLQGACISTAEVENVCEFVGNQRGYPSAMHLPAIYTASYSRRSFDPDEVDPMLFDAARLVVLHQQGSTSLIQRKMKLGYNRAGRIIDQLEAAGVIGPFEGSKARDVLFSDEFSLETHFKAMKKIM